MNKKKQKNNDPLEDWVKALQGKSVSDKFDKEEYEKIIAFRERILWENAKEEAKNIPPEETQKAWVKFQEKIKQETSNTPNSEQISATTGENGEKNKPLSSKPVTNIAEARKEKEEKKKMPWKDWMSMAASFAALGVSLYLFNNIQARYEIMEQQSQRTLEISEEILSKDFSAVSKGQSNPMLPKYVAKGEIPQEFTMSRKEIEKLLYDLAIVNFRVVMKKEENKIRITIDDIYPLRVAKENTLDHYSIDTSPENSFVVLIVTLESK